MLHGQYVTTLNLQPLSVPLILREVVMFLSLSPGDNDGRPPAQSTLRIMGM